MNNKRVLVTGGAGFIGCNFVRFLLEHDPEVTVVNLDALTYSGNLASLGEYLKHPRHHFVKGSITNTELVLYLLQEHALDGIINFAAESHVDRSITNPGLFVETNVLGTQSLLTAALAAGIKRFLQVSTDEVYGSLGTSGKFREDTHIAPNSPYSASKAGADHLVRAAHHTHGMDTVITRCSNNYGPYQFPEKMLPLMINNARQDRPLPVYGDGLNIRDWLHVSDHCQAIWRVYEDGRAGEVYNVGGNNEYTNLDVVRTVLRQLDKPESLIRFVTDRPGHDRRYAIDAEKIHTELGWTPQIDFTTGIAETIMWYMTNEEWLGQVVSGAYQEYYAKMYGNR